MANPYQSNLPWQDPDSPFQRVQRAQEERQQARAARNESFRTDGVTGAHQRLQNRLEHLRRRARQDAQSGRGSTGKDLWNYAGSYSDEEYNFYISELNRHLAASGHSPSGTNGRTAADGRQLAKQLASRLANTNRQSPNDWLWAEINNLAGYGDSNAVDQVLSRQAQTARERHRGMSAEYQRRLDQLASMFNTGEDPWARQLYEAGRTDLDAQLNNALPSIQMAYDQGRADQLAGAQRAVDTGRELGVRYSDLFTDGADAIRADNDALAQAYADTYGVVGSTGPVAGEGADIADVVAASAPIQQALSENIGQIYSETANMLADQMQGYAASEQASARNATAAAQAQLYEQFMAAEMQRQQQERAALRDAQLRLVDMFYQDQAASLDRLDSLQMQRAQQDNWAQQMFRDITIGHPAARYDELVDQRAGRSSQLTPEMQAAVDELYNAGSLRFSENLSGEPFPEVVDRYGPEIAANFHAAFLAALSSSNDPYEQRRIFESALMDAGIEPEVRDIIADRYGLHSNTFFGG